MPFGLENMTPGQRQLLTIGAPLVAAVALGAKLLGSRNAAPAATAAPAPAGALPAISTGAVDTGQLGEFESGVTGALVGVQQAITQLQNSSANTPSAPTTPASSWAATMPYTVGAGSNTASEIAVDIAAYTHGDWHPLATDIRAANPGRTEPYPAGTILAIPVGGADGGHV